MSGALANRQFSVSEWRADPKPNLPCRGGPVGTKWFLTPNVPRSDVVHVRESHSRKRAICQFGACVSKAITTPCSPRACVPCDRARSCSARPHGYASISHAIDNSKAFPGDKLGLEVGRATPVGVN